jgi:hypothetical protein
MTHSLAGEGVGGPNYDEGTDTLVLYILQSLYGLARQERFKCYSKHKGAVLKLL